LVPFRPATRFAIVFGTRPMRFEVVNIVLGVLIGSMVGLGIYTFVYAKGYSYLSNDPRGRANCHVMRTVNRARRAIREEPGDYWFPMVSSA